MAADDNPQNSIEYMLGKLDGKMDALKQSVDTSATSQGTFNATMQTKITAIESRLVAMVSARQEADAALETRVSILEALRPMRHGWPIVWGAIASIALSLFTVVYTLMHAH